MMRLLLHRNRFFQLRRIDRLGCHRNRRRSGMFHFDLNHFNGDIEQVLALMRHAIAPIDLSRASSRLRCCAILDCRSGMCVCYRHNDSACMAVHRRLCVRRVVNSGYADLLVFKFDFNVVSRRRRRFLRTHRRDHQNSRKKCCSYSVHLVSFASRAAYPSLQGSATLSHAFRAGHACLRLDTCQRTISYCPFPVFPFEIFIPLPREGNRVKKGH